LKILTFAVGVAIAIGGIASSAPAFAQDHRGMDHRGMENRDHRGNGYNRGHDRRWNNHRRSCRTVWRHHRRIQVCR
jgi:hypothetical protein